MASILKAILAATLLQAIASACIGQEDTSNPRTGPVAPGGETEAVESPARPASPRFNFLGDTKKFSRLGGWGGIGGTMGQWGLGRATLANMPAVQKELEITDEQRQKMRELAEGMREKGEGMAESMRERGQELSRSMNVTAAFQMLGTFQQLLQEYERGLARILDAKQRKRLDQIALQMEGVTALSRPEIADRLHLTEDQRIAIQQILAGAQVRQMGYWMQQGMAMRDRARRSREAAAARSPETENRPDAATTQPRPKGQPEAPRDADEPLSPEEEAARAARRAERMKEFQTQFDGMRTGADRIQEETVKAILKVLVSGQRKTFDKLLGPPFDPEGLLQPATTSSTDAPSTPPTDAAQAPPAPSDATPSEPTRRPAPRVRRPSSPPSGGGTSSGDARS